MSKFQAGNVKIDSGKNITFGDATTQTSAAYTEEESDALLAKTSREVLSLGAYAYEDSYRRIGYTEALTSSGDSVTKTFLITADFIGGSAMVTFDVSKSGLSYVIDVAMHSLVGRSGLSQIFDDDSFLIGKTSNQFYFYIKQNSANWTGYNIYELSSAGNKGFTYSSSDSQTLPSHDSYTYSSGVSVNGNLIYHTGNDSTLSKEVLSLGVYAYEDSYRRIGYTEALTSSGDSVTKTFLISADSIGGSAMVTFSATKSGFSHIKNIDIHSLTGKSGLTYIFDDDSFFIGKSSNQFYFYIKQNSASWTGYNIYELSSAGNKGFTYSAADSQTLPSHEDYVYSSGVSVNGNLIYHTGNDANLVKLDAANTFTGVNQFNIVKTPSTVTVNETADYLGAFRLNSSTASSNGDRIPLVFNIGSNTSPNISAVIEAGREAVGWKTYLAFYTNNITAGPESTDAIQEKMRLSGDGVLTVTGETVYHTGNDANLAKLASSNAFTGTNNYFQNYINIGKNGGGDSIAYFYDDTGNVYRSLRFAATGQKWQLTDSTGTLRDIYHSGNDSNLAKLDSSNTFSNLLSVDSISPQIRLVETDTTTKAVFNQDGGQLYIQVSSTGYVGSGTIRITGTNNTDIGDVTIRSGSVDHSVYHAGNDSNLAKLDASNQFSDIQYFNKDSSVANVEQPWSNSNARLVNADLTDGNFCALVFSARDDRPVTLTAGAVVLECEDHTAATFKTNMYLGTTNNGTYSSKVKVTASGDVEILHGGLEVNGVITGGALTTGNKQLINHNTSTAWFGNTSTATYLQGSNVDISTSGAATVNSNAILTANTVSATFTTTDGKTVTVVNGQVTSVV